MQDLEKMTGIPLVEKMHFCVGPRTRLHLWYARKSQLNVDWGTCRMLYAFFYYSLKLTAAPLRCAASTLSPIKEQAYLKQFGRLLLPFDRAKREGYHYQEQSLPDHIVNWSATSSLRRSFTKPGPQSFPHPSSWSPAEQYHRFQVVQLYLVICRPDRLRQHTWS